ncbi:DJ-1/PfpI family protein [Pleionea mediterranea]|nr:DJ-1/PfpI family protein [Pleionea mediterranea]
MKLLFKVKRREYMQALKNKFASYAGLKVFMMTVILLLSGNMVNAKNDGSESAKQTTVGILIYDGVQIIDFTGPWEIFGHAGFKVKTIAQNTAPLKTAMNMTVVPDYSFNNAPQFDVLLIPGGNHGNALNKPTNDWLKQQAPKAESVLSVCTGSFILAETGLLSNKTATTFFKSLDYFANEYPTVEVVRDQRYVDNGKVITSAGLSSGIDAALHLVAKIKGLDAARNIAMHVEYDWQPDNGFVRGKMADKFMPRFKLPLPEQVKFNRIYAYGDEQNWYEAFKVSFDNSTESPIQGVKDILSNQFAALTNWKALPNSESRWQATFNQEKWVLSVDNELDSHEDKGVLMKVELQKQ